MAKRCWSNRERVLLVYGLAVVLFLLCLTLACTAIVISVDKDVVDEISKYHNMFKNYNLYVSCTINMFVSFMYYRVVVEFDSIKLQMKPLALHFDFFAFLVLFTAMALLTMAFMLVPAALSAYLVFVQS
ncbi:hypothetical protein BC374_02505 [Ensifer sp. LC13]|uniref:hypothetical protein n=1 Tax=unclassified Ensifer TaxID=2633371 RepID=UPI00081376A5|nr:MULTISPECIES: hypothetical protein [unclassified Ensifer]OCP09452.1 hypothetical protein BC374_02505 [Ensifer sp. LC13]OCP10626.1 hypothetical protein BBX50_02850 [Ensifer sp. LC11]OCP32700.1 hypothetical protein BC364_02505 [Ensifer sp. LC499]